MRAPELHLPSALLPVCDMLVSASAFHSLHCRKSNRSARWISADDTTLVVDESRYPSLSSSNPYPPDTQLIHSGRAAFAPPHQQCTSELVERHSFDTESFGRR
ncbi:hypothetical protein EDB19DRAFT_1772990 [Suillus lakei]|nr:hypothetical protein EDB19DRAFT_1772990 [Suillus lakei]